MDDSFLSSFFLIFLFFGHMAHGILVPRPEIEPVPLPWKRGALTTGPPEKYSCFFSWNDRVFFPSELFILYWGIAN